MARLEIKRKGIMLQSGKPQIRGPKSRGLSARRKPQSLNSAASSCSGLQAAARRRDALEILGLLKVQ